MQIVENSIEKKKQLYLYIYIFLSSLGGKKTKGTTEKLIYTYLFTLIKYIKVCMQLLFKKKSEEKISKVINIYYIIFNNMLVLQEYRCVYKEKIYNYLLLYYI